MSEFVVEKVLNRRTRADGEREYLLKWRGWSHESNTWEPVKNLCNCRHLIESFEEEQKSISKMSSSQTFCKNGQGPPMNFRVPKVSGFDRGFVADKIVGATNNGELTYLVKWIGLKELELVPSRLARYKCPELVIEFFEQHVTWK